MRRRSFVEEEDSDDEEVRGRRVSRRHHKRIKYCEDAEVVDREDEDKDTEEDEEQPGPSHRFDQTTQEELESLQNLEVLPVTCGNKKGSLHKEKLENGESCIKCEGRWFSPSDFENFCGKGATKKWKTSILYEKKPLQFWIERGLLSTKGFKKRSTRTQKRKIPSSDSSSDSSSGSSSKESAEENEKEDSRDEEWVPDGDELMEENENKNAGAENGGGDSSEAEAANDGHDCGERGKHLSETEKMGQALKGEAKVVLERLSVAKVDPQSFSMRNSVSGSGEGPLDDDTQKEAEGELTASTEDSPETSAGTTPLKDTQMHIRAVIVEEKDAPEEITLIDTGIQDEQRGIKTEPVNNLPQSADNSEILHETKLEGSIQPPSSCDLDKMDLEQLKREKIKMQLKVLKLQEEYYTFKVMEHRKSNENFLHPFHDY